LKPFVFQIPTKVKKGKKKTGENVVRGKVGHENILTRKEKQSGLEKKEEKKKKGRGLGTCHQQVKPVAGIRVQKPSKKKDPRGEDTKIRT